MARYIVLVSFKSQHSAIEAIYIPFTRMELHHYKLNIYTFCDKPRREITRDFRLDVERKVKLAINRTEMLTKRS
jgi:hypothetical protein